MELRAAWLTDVGKKRANNEDALLAADRLVAGVNGMEPETAVLRGDRLLFVVADGVGGAEKGEVASRLALETFRDGAEGIADEAALAATLAAARARLNAHVRDHPGARGMGTALAGMLIDGGGALAFNCGDCRVYRQNGAFLERITRDHSLVQKLADIGEITEEEMRTHPRKNVITSAVVGDLREDPPELYARRVELAPGQRLLAVSDGVWESFDHAQLESCLEAGAPPEACVARIRDAVREGECRDNFTVVLVEALP